MNQTMHTNVFSRIELGFWNLTIQALSTSQTTRSLFTSTYRFIRRQNTLAFGALVGASGLVGLVSGYLFYVISTLG